MKAALKRRMFGEKVRAGGYEGKAWGEMPTWRRSLSVGTDTVLMQICKARGLVASY